MKREHVHFAGHATLANSDYAHLFVAHGLNGIPMEDEKRIAVHARAHGTKEDGPADTRPSSAGENPRRNPSVA